MGTISCNCSAVGALSKMLTEDAGAAPRTFNSSSDRIEFLAETLGSMREIQHTNAITGTLSRSITGVRPHSYLVQGTIALQPSPSQLALWLPRIFGGTPGALGSGTGLDVDGDGKDRNYPLTNVLPKWDSLHYRENGIFQYTELQVAQAILRGKTSNGGEATEFMELILVVVGQQEIITQSGGASPWPVTEPALPSTIDFNPYAFWETKFLMNGTELDYEQFTMTVDNMLAIKFYNKQYPTCIRSTGRRIRMDARLPFTCTGLARSLTMNTTTGTAEFRMETPNPVQFHTSFRLPYARSTFKTPTAAGRQDIPLEISVEGFSSTGNDEMAITNDNEV